MKWVIHLLFLNLSVPLFPIPTETRNMKIRKGIILVTVALGLSGSSYAQKLTFDQLIEASCDDLADYTPAEGMDMNGLIDLVNELAARRENESQRQVLVNLKQHPGMSQERAQEIFYLDFYDKMFDNCPKFMEIAHFAFGTERTVNEALEEISQDVTEILLETFEGTYQEKMDHLMGSLDDIWHANSDLIYSTYLGGFEDENLQPDVAKYLLLHNDEFAKLTVLCIVDRKRRNE